MCIVTICLNLSELLFFRKCACLQTKTSNIYKKLRKHQLELSIKRMDRTCMFKYLLRLDNVLRYTCMLIQLQYDLILFAFALYVCPCHWLTYMSSLRFIPVPPPPHQSAGLSQSITASKVIHHTRNFIAWVNQNGLGEHLISHGLNVDVCYRHIYI